MIGKWSDARLAAQTVAVPVAENDVDAVASEVRSGVGGVVLFGSSAPSNLAASLRSLDALAPGAIAPFVMVDEEGGSVQRIANLVGSLPAARTIGATMTSTQIRELGETFGRKLKQLGVTMDLAPVLDVDGGHGPNATDVDGTRSFSANATTAGQDGVAFAQGLAKAGVIPVAKHFPGLGGSVGNTDLAPASTVAWKLEQTIGLVPFQRFVAAGLGAIMVANANIPGLTGLPASVSPQVISGVIRQRLHFGGLVLTDSLSVKSLTARGYTTTTASVAALEAGADMVLFNALPSVEASTTSNIVKGIVNAVATGHLPRSQLVRAVVTIVQSKHANVCD